MLFLQEDLLFVLQSRACVPAALRSPCVPPLLGRKAEVPLGAVYELQALHGHARHPEDSLLGGFTML